MRKLGKIKLNHIRNTHPCKTRNIRNGVPITRQPLTGSKTGVEDRVKTLGLLRIPVNSIVRADLRRDAEVVRLSYSPKSHDQRVLETTVEVWGSRLTLHGPNPTHLEHQPAEHLIILICVVRIRDRVLWVVLVC